MKTDPPGRWQSLAVVGISANIVSFALYQYYRISANYFTVPVLAVLMSGVILSTLIAWGSWAGVFASIAKAKGQPLQYAALAPLRPIGLAVMLYVLKDNNARHKPYANFRHRNIQRNLAKGRAR